MEIKSNPTVAIIACCKMEELYIKEWLDWHLNVVGIDHIYLCDNNDIDYSVQLSEVIQDYILSGAVTLIDYRGVFPIQPMCYTETYNTYGENFDWFVIIDIDEFLSLPRFNNKLKPLLQLDHIKDNVYFSVLCRIYNDNNLVTYDPRPCQERFTKETLANDIKSAKTRYSYGNLMKSVVKGIKYAGFAGQIKPSIYHQHDCFNYYPDFKRIDIFGNQISQQLLGGLWPLKEFPGCDEQKYLESCYNTCCIKHYMTKTIDEYIKQKIIRGDTLIEKEDIHTYPYNIAQFFEFNEYTEEKNNFIKINYPDLYNVWSQYLKRVSV